MDKIEKNIEKMLDVYRRNECTKEEIMQIRKYLVEHPEQIIRLILQMRSDVMTELKLDPNQDPFSQMMGDVIRISQSGSIMANYRLQNAIDSIVSEKKYEENVPNQQNHHNVNEDKQKTFNYMETIKLNSAEFKAINALALQMMENINSEKTTLGNMVVQLLIHVPEMSAENATNVCRQLIKGVTHFNQALTELKEKGLSAEAITESVYDQCMNTLFGKTENEQVAILVNFISFLKFIDAENIGGAALGEDTKTMEQLLSENKNVDGEITQEILDGLKEELKESIANSTIVLTQESELRELISCANGDSTLVEALAKKHMDSVEFKSYAALAAYIACLKGNIAGCDANVQPEVLGASVAAGVERERVMEEAKKGIISWDTAVTCLKWIGGALLISLFAWLCLNIFAFMFAGTTLLSMAILGESFLSLAAGIILGGFISYKGTTWFIEDVAIPVVEGAGEVYDRVINALKEESLIERTKKAYAHVVEFFQKIWSAITSSFVGSGVHSTVNL